MTELADLRQTLQDGANTPAVFPTVPPELTRLNAYRRGSTIIQ